jgi:cysteine desulfurase family protein (TIGR01976 family)
MNSDFPISWVRAQFPALNRGDEFIFFDNGAGAQIPQIALNAVQNHLICHNVQRGGRYRHSLKVDESIQRARNSVAAFLNASLPDEIAFGMNATSFIRIVSLGIAEIMGPRREIIVTDLDHEANIATWLALEKRGAQIRWWKVRDDALLHIEDLEPLLSPRTRLVASAMASNALGSIVNVKEVSRLAHAAGAEVFVDAVHYAPHGPIDVQDLDCDYLVCSGYKIFAPHMGFLWGKAAALDALPTFREDFIPDKAPMKIEIGTFVYENVAGMNAALEYLAELGGSSDGNLRQRLARAMELIREYERKLSHALLDGISTIKNAVVYGIKDTNVLRRRVPTLCFNMGSLPPELVVSRLADKNIGVRDGHMYSPRLMKRLGLSPEQGALRASLVHYNTGAEVSRFLSALEEISKQA